MSPPARLFVHWHLEVMRRKTSLARCVRKFTEKAFRFVGPRAIAVGLGGPVGAAFTEGGLLWHHFPLVPQVVRLAKGSGAATTDQGTDIQKFGHKRPPLLNVNDLGCKSTRERVCAEKVI